jgi:hypothetical protein
VGKEIEVPDRVMFSIEDIAKDREADEYLKDNGVDIFGPRVYFVNANTPSGIELFR